MFTSSSSSSCHAISTDIPDPLSPPLHIVDCFQQVLTVQLYVQGDQKKKKQNP